MKRAHIAFFQFPYAAGVVSTLSLVATLVRRGYRVTYVTSEQYSSRVIELGANFIRCPPFTPSPNYATAETLLVDMAAQTLMEVTPFFDANRPDLIIYDFVTCAGRVLAEKWQVPAVQISPAFAFRNNQPSLQPASSDYGHELLVVDRREVNSFFGRHGIDGNYPFHREELNIYFYHEALELDGRTFDERCFYAARCAGEQPYHRRWKKRDLGDRPILLVTTSTVAIQGSDYFQMCVEALAGLDWYVILAIGDNNHPEAFEPLPPHFEIIQHIPQIQVLAHTNLLICLGGMTITMEAMYHGVPLLMITQGFSEGELYAENSARFGLGKHLRKDETTPESIRASVLSISKDTRVLTRVKEMQRLVQRSPGAEDAANRIIEHLDATVEKSLRPR